MNKNETVSKSTICPKPFLKWAGGKTQLLNDIEEYLLDDFDSKINKYFEPFVGGGAVFFHLIKKFHFDHVYLGDINGDLILTYKVIQNDLDELITELKILSNEYYDYKSDNERKDMFYRIRDEFNIIHCTGSKLPRNNRIEVVSKMIFLNKTCFNGLYKVNKKGEFNVPFAYSKKPLICDEENLLNVEEKLQDVVIKHADYHKSKKNMDENSFVYMDPPYRPINGKKSFEGYTNLAFDDDNQKELKDFCKEIDEKYDVKFILNNSDPTNYNEDDSFFKEMYNEFKIKPVHAKRSINSNGNNRGKIRELLVYNYEKNNVHI